LTQRSTATEEVPGFFRIKTFRPLLRVSSSGLPQEVAGRLQNKKKRKR